MVAAVDAVNAPHDDVEVEAMQAVHDALKPLSRSACSRVISWAENRYTRLDIADGDLEGFTKLTESLIEASRIVGNVTPQDIIRLAGAVEAESEPDGA